MHLTKEDLSGIEKIKRLNIINSISGIKPANLIGTVSEAGVSNLAIFSSVIHIGSNPAILGCILRPTGEVPRHTYQNIMEHGYYTINHVPASYTEQAHYTSAKFSYDQSEFEHCGFKEEYVEGFIAPFVKESNLKIGMRYVEGIPIEINNTLLIIGEVEHLIVPDDAIGDEGFIDLEEIGTAGISGLNSYYKLNKIGQYPYARTRELPNFSKKE